MHASVDTRFVMTWYGEHPLLREIAPAALGPGPAKLKILIQILEMVLYRLDFPED